MEVKKVIAVDPGTFKSGFAVWDGRHILDFGILDNEDAMILKLSVQHLGDTVLAIEKIESYGMAVGHSIFETVFWTGRFVEAFQGTFFRVPRKAVKLHICGQVRAKDSNIVQALADRFAPGVRNKGKGIKKAPGFFYGFKGDIWQAFALAVTWWDLNNIRMLEMGGTKWT